MIPKHVAMAKSSDRLLASLRSEYEDALQEYETARGFVSGRMLGLTASTTHELQREEAARLRLMAARARYYQS